MTSKAKGGSKPPHPPPMPRGKGNGGQVTAGQLVAAAAKLNAIARPRERQPKDAGANSGAANLYYNCLKDPFNPKYFGARVPDQYAVATSTHQIHRVTTVTTDASGNFQLLIVPSAFYHCVAVKGTMSNASTWLKPSNVSVTTASLYCDPASLANKLVNHRIVNYAIKIKSIASISSNQGVVEAVSFPAHTKIPAAFSVGGQNATNAADTLDRILTTYGLPLNGTGDSATVDTTCLSNFPEYVNCQTLKVSEKTLVINPKITEPTCFEFRQSYDNQWGTDVGIGLATGSIYTGDASYSHVDGFQSVFISGTGMPVSTAVCEIEIIYHLEGTPRVTGGLNNGFIPTAAKSVSHFQGFMTALDKFSRLPVYTFVDEAVGMAGRLLAR